MTKAELSFTVKDNCHQTKLLVSYSSYLHCTHLNNVLHDTAWLFTLRCKSKPVDNWEYRETSSTPSNFNNRDTHTNYTVGITILLVFFSLLWLFMENNPIYIDEGRPDNRNSCNTVLDHHKLQNDNKVASTPDKNNLEPLWKQALWLGCCIRLH